MIRPLLGLLFYFLVPLATTQAESELVFRRLAGPLGGLGNTDGPAASAEFYRPAEIAFDSKGNLWVADDSTESVRRITPQGQVSTIAGTVGRGGKADGPLGVGSIGEVRGLAFDATGNAYFAENGYNLVRKIGADGVLSTVAGTGNIGDVDGAINVAQFNRPAALTIDSSGTIFLFDSGKIKKISGGLVTTYFTWPTNDPEKQLAGTRSLVLDGNGGFFIGDFGRVLRLSAAGEISIVAGSTESGTADGQGASARFGGWLNLRLDPAGNIVVADLTNHSIRRVTPSGLVSTIAGRSGEPGDIDGPATAARFRWPEAIAIDSAGTIYVGDASGRIRTIAVDGNVATLAGAGLSTGFVDGVGSTARFSDPTALCVDSSENVFVCDSGNKAVRKITPSGNVSTFPIPAGAVATPTGIAVDATGNVYVADGDSNCIYELAGNGAWQVYAGQVGAAGLKDGFRTAAQFAGPAEIKFDKSGNLFVVDRRNGKVRKISPDGTVSTLGGKSVGFSDPVGVAIAPNGDVYVADQTAVIGKIPAGGTSSIIAGASVRRGYVDGQGTSARFFTPSAIAIDANGILYVTDGNCIRAIDTALNVTTFIGDPYVSGTINGPRPVVRLSGARGLSISAAGKFYIAESGNAGVRIGERLNARLANIATRAFCGGGDNVAIGGFVIGGSAPKRVLVRAVGPTLIKSGIAANEVLADPTLDLYRGSAVIASNDDWGQNTNATSVATLTDQIGAAPLDSTDTASSALLLTLDPGVYTFVVHGKNASTGIVLLEVYDADLGAGDSSLLNIASRAKAGTGSAVTIAGFVVSGEGAKRVLMRAVGPSLAAQGIAPASLLSDPVLEVHDAHANNAVIATNDDWTQNSDIGLLTSTAARIGAFPLDANDHTSSALVLTLQPGVYTFVANGKNSSAGIVLVEVYDAD